MSDDLISRNWNRTDRHLPPAGVIVETMDSSGRVQDLRRDGGLFWLPDGSMYVYYVPLFWRLKPEGRP